jgi:hypothetical protein
MATTPYQPGDGMRARVSTPFVQAGTLGTIVQVYPTMHNAYEVLFDREAA